MLGLGFATKDGASFTPMAAEEAAKQEQTKAVNVGKYTRNPHRELFSGVSLRDCL